MIVTGKRAAAVGAVALAFLLGWLTGHGGQRVVTQTVTVKDTTTTDQQKTQQTHQDVAKTATDQRAGQVVVRWRTRQVVDAHGNCVAETEGERVEVQKESRTETSTASTATATTEHDRTTTSRTETATRREVSPALPRLLVGVGAGLSLPAALGHAAPDRQVLPFLPSRVAGLITIDARVAGSLYAGVWATTSGVAGVGLRLGF